MNEKSAEVYRERKNGRRKLSWGAFLWDDTDHVKYYSRNRFRVKFDVEFTNQVINFPFGYHSKEECEIFLSDIYVKLETITFNVPCPKFYLR